MVSVFTNGTRDRGSVPGRIIPKNQQMVLDASLLNTQHYKVRIKIKWSNLEKGVVTSVYRYWIGNFRVALDRGQLT